MPRVHAFVQRRDERLIGRFVTYRDACTEPGQKLATSLLRRFDHQPRIATTWTQVASAGRRVNRRTD